MTKKLLRHRMAVVVTATAIALVAPGLAHADTAEELAAATEQVDELSQQANSAYQEAQKADADLAQLDAELAALTQQLAAAGQQVVSSRAEVGRVARASYAAGGIEPTLMLLLADDSQALAAGIADLRRVADATTATLANSVAQEASLAQTQAAVAVRQREAAEIRVQRAAALAEMEAKVAAAEALQAQLEQKYADELAAAREAERQAAEAAAAQAAAEQAARLAAASQPAGGNLVAPGQAGSVPTSAGSVEAVLSFALAQVGKQYRLGARGPDAYDCSSLVSASYRQIGVNLPSYTKYQANQTRQVPLSQAQPGDLLFFFGRGADHVALYLGNGKMVHAVNPRTGIVVGSINESWYRDRLTSVGRVVG